MGQVLKSRLKQKKFRSPRHEAALNLFLAANHVQKIVDDICHEFDLTSQQYNILRILRGVHPDGHRCAGIRERMLDRSPDITRRLDTLEKLGYVKRRRSTEDRRAVLTYITEKGLSILEEIEPYMDSIDKKLGDRLTVKEARELSSLCESVYRVEVEAE